MHRVRLRHRQHRRRPALVGALLAAVALAASITAASPASAAPVPTFTWTGFDANVGNTNWSSGANWVGGVAPTAPGPVNLVFPTPGTCTTPSCNVGANDLTGLVVGSITVADRPGIRMSGNEITLTGAISIARTGSVTFELPIATSAPTSTWTIDDATSVSFSQATGPTHLTISLANGTRFTGRMHTASLVLAGADPTAAPAENGTVSWEAGTSPTAVRHLALDTLGAYFGSHFATEGADVAIRGIYFRAVRADLTVQGNAALDAATSIVVTRYNIETFPPTLPNTTHLSGLRVAGSLDLASAAVTVDLTNRCLPLGLPLSFATSAPNALRGTLTRPIAGGGRVPVADGAIIAGINAPTTCALGTSSLLRIDYDDAAGVVTATAVEPPTPPTIAVATSHTPTVPDLPITYTATVSPAPPDGTVAFTDDGVAISGCSARPVVPSTGQATCTTSYAASGNHVVTATYDGGTSLPPAGPSPPITQVVVPAPTATITSPSGMSIVGTPIEGTASDVGGPGVLGVLLYFHSYTGGPSGSVVAACPSCGPGQTDVTWSFTPPAGSIPGIYSLVAQPYDVAFNPGPPSNVVYQVIV